eukprot:scaffold12.g8249.t1
MERRSPATVLLALVLAACLAASACAAPARAFQGRRLKQDPTNMVCCRFRGNNQQCTQTFPQSPPAQQGLVNVNAGCVAMVNAGVCIGNVAVLANAACGGPVQTGSGRIVNTPGSALNLPLSLGGTTGAGPTGGGTTGGTTGGATGGATGALQDATLAATGATGGTTGR